MINLEKKIQKLSTPKHAYWNASSRSETHEGWSKPESLRGCNTDSIESAGPHCSGIDCFRVSSGRRIRNCEQRGASGSWGARVVRAGPHGGHGQRTAIGLARSADRAEMHECHEDLALRLLEASQQENQVALLVSECPPKRFRSQVVRVHQLQL